MAVTAAVTVESNGSFASGNEQWAIINIVPTGTYVTGGFAVDIPAGNADIQNIRFMEVKGSGRLLEWNPATQLLLVKAWATAGATVAASEITNGTDIGAADTGGYRAFVIGQ